jgi:hypothetical protein
MKSKFVLIVPLILAFGWLTLFVGITKVDAAIISPPFDDRVFVPGKSYKGSFTVYFTNEDPQTLYLSLAKMEIDDVTGAKSAVFIPKTEPALANWVTLDKQTVLRPPGVTFTEGDNGTIVNYAVNIPADAAPGGNYAVVLISNVPRGPEVDDSQVQVDTGVGVGADVTYQLIARIDGEEINNTNLEGFETVHVCLPSEGRDCNRYRQWLFPHLPVGFDAVFQNRGNSHVVPRGNIEIFQGEKIANVALNSDQVRVFPGKSRLYENMWTHEGIEKLQDQTLYEQALAGLPDNFFESVLYQIQHFQFGMYTVKLGGYAGNQPAFGAEANFWIVPWHLILTIIVLILLGYLGWRINRKFRGAEYVSQKSSKYKRATTGK